MIGNASWICFSTSPAAAKFMSWLMAAPQWRHGLNKPFNFFHKENPQGIAVSFRNPCKGFGKIGPYRCNHWPWIPQDLLRNCSLKSSSRLSQDWLRVSLHAKFNVSILLVQQLTCSLNKLLKKRQVLREVSQRCPISNMTLYVYI